MYDNPIYPTSLNTRTNTHTHVYVDVCARVCTHMCVDVLKFIQRTHARVTSTSCRCFTMQRTGLPPKCDQEMRQKNAREDDAHLSFLVFECFFLMRCHESTMLLKPRGVEVFAL